MTFSEVIELIGKVLDAVGVAVIVVGVLYAAFLTVTRGSDRYTRVRYTMGRAILLGLEVLVAADIIRTVAIAPTLENAGVLAIIVGVRTVLSFTLTMEIENRLPWQRPTAD